jgi:hypothetical protein
MRGRGSARGARFVGGLAAVLLLCAVALSTRPAMAETGTAASAPSIFAPSDAKPPEDTAWWWRKRYLAFYKTLSYTAVVLTTDQLWYMAVATQAATSSGFFGAVNLVTSPMLTYGFEYAWQHAARRRRDRTGSGRSTSGRPSSTAS